MIVNTGRDRGSSHESLNAAGKALDLTKRPGIYSNGARVYGDDGDLIHVETVSEQLVRPIVEYVTKKYPDFAVCG